MKHLVYIVSGPKCCGKTTSLLKWMRGRSDVFGILSPVENGKRHFMNASTCEKFRMEAEAGENDVLEIGKYKFSKDSFNKATLILMNGMNKGDGWLVIDEIGPLELKGDGFHKVLNEILDRKQNNLKVLIVVRNELVNDVISKFNIKPYFTDLTEEATYF